VIQARTDADRTLTHARVRLGDEGSADVREAEAKHKDPSTALQRALSALRRWPQAAAWRAESFAHGHRA
jgi:hypothetical protein